jgi:hypothetical protein
MVSGDDEVVRGYTMMCLGLVERSHTRRLWAGVLQSVRCWVLAFARQTPRFMRVLRRRSLRNCVSVPDGACSFIFGSFLRKSQDR